MAHFLGSSATLAAKRPSSLAAAASLAAGATIAGVSTWYYPTLNEAAATANTADKSKVSPSPSAFQMEVHLMDKIQQKQYLSSAQDAIPSTLRILAIDLPEMRTSAFSGDCRLAHDKIFVEDVASPKVIMVGGDRSEEQQQQQATEEAKHINQSSVETSPDKVAAPQRNKKATKLKVAQKTLVKSLVQCRSSQSQHRVGVELLEASVADLNKYKLRKTHQFGSFKYDPGKYYASEKKEDTVQEVPNVEEQASSNKEGIIEEVPLDKASFEDESEAPWNQYAWAEELRLRINGQVGFDAPLEKSTPWHRHLFGQAYKITVHPVYHFWEWPLPSFAKSNPDGIDGRYRSNCRASNKPHAVIANGAALQRVPSSMRLLQKLCKKADVPLFVVHDPRVWGGNTHETLSEALKDMRSTIKNRVISRALEQQGSTAFTRGRMLGQVETETKWLVKEQKRKSKEMFNSLGGRRQRKSDSDWSQLDSIRLERRLVQRGVIKETTKSDGEGSSVIQKTYTEALINLARRCVQDVEEQQMQEQEPPQAEQSSRNASSSTEASTSTPAMNV